MESIVKLLKGLWMIIRRPALMNLVLKEQTQFKRSVERKYKIRALPKVNFSELVEQNVSVKPYAFLDGGSMPTDLALLKSLAMQRRGGVYFEVGTWRGESIANVAPFMDKAYTLNLSTEELQKIKWPDDFIKQLRFYSQDIPNVKHLEGNSFTFDFTSFHNTVDLIFIDGDHSYEGVKNDTKKVLSMLKDDQSVIVWHDYAFHPDNIRYDVFQGILDGMPEAEHEHLYYISNTKCAIYCKEKLSSYVQEVCPKPEKTFEVKLTYNAV